MYKCCLRYANVVLRRRWNLGGEDALELCPGNGVSKEGSTYVFVLADNRTITFACPTDSGRCDILEDGPLFDGPCYRDTDCQSGNCYFPCYEEDDDDTGFCVCNCADNEVCSQECTVNYNAFDDIGGEECDRCISRLPPSCYIKMGEACTSGDSCVTGHCVNGTCGCSPITHYPCDAETEACKFSKCELRTPSCTPQGEPYKIIQYEVGMPTISLADLTNMYDCCQNLGDVSLDREWHANATTSGSPPKRSDRDPIDICPGQGVSKEGDTYRFTRTDGTVVEAKCSLATNLCTLSGDGLASSSYCFRNENCRSENCYVNPDSSYAFGSCECKPNTQIGCEHDIETRICASPEMVLEITGTLQEGRNGCFLKVGEPCNRDFRCLSHNCDKKSSSLYNDPPGVCACNPVTDYPCDVEGGEKCVISSGSYTCK